MKKQSPIAPRKPPGRQRQAQVVDARLPTAHPVETLRRTNWRDLLGIDPRSLAVFRIAIAALVLSDLAVRATDLNSMYTDSGMFSRAEICRLATSIWNWSFHFGSGAWGYQAMLFGIAAALGFALLVGFETRLATIGSWLMLVSIHHRVPPILSGAETLLRNLMFWAMFLPLERAWSLDGWRGRRRGSAPAQEGRAPVLSVASAAILAQMGLMYLFSAIFKSNAQWFRGDALAGILAHDFYAAPPAGFLLQFPRLLAVMTWCTLAFEWAAVLLFLPRCASRLRLGFIAALAVMHLGIAVCLEVGLFSYVALAGLTLFLPAEFWNSRLLARFSRPSAPDTQRAATGKPVAKKRPPLFYATQVGCGMLLLYVFALNFNSLRGRPLAQLAPENWRPLTRGLGLSQSWGMFASIPSKDGWYVARARLRDGSEVDLLRQGKAVDWSQPRFPARFYPNYYWQKLFREMAYDDEQGFQLFRAPVAAYLCRNWNARNAAEKQVAEFDFIYCGVDEAEAKTLSIPRILREPLFHLDLNDP